MRPVVGVICEYDPFHIGHARQFALIRRQLPDAYIVCVMSGCFTQRGMPTLFAPAFRAETALRAGADAVLELPCAFAVREAENFAVGGVSLLNALGCVTHLSFGLETDNLPQLQAAAAVLETPDDLFTDTLRVSLANGSPFSAAQADAVAASLTADRGDDSTSPEALSHLLAQPNNILGICYLRALLRLKSSILPLPVLRVGRYHASALTREGYPSATAVRKAYLSDDLSAAEQACGYPLTGIPCHRPEALDTVLLHQLRGIDADALRALPDCTEGLENRIIKASRAAVNRADLLACLKTRRYTYARLNRLAAHALLGITTDLLTSHPLPEYARLLGFRRESRELLTAFYGSPIPIIAKAADGNPANPLYALDARAYDLWALGAGLPAGLMYKQKIVKYEYFTQRANPLETEI